MANVDEIHQNYAEFLRVKHDLQYRLFKHREGSNPQAARAEAVVFSFLRAHGLNPQIEEDPHTGGVDFICGRGPNTFYVEVTSIDQRTVAERSGIPNEIQEEKGIWFDFITRSLWNRVYKKTRQFSALTRPALLIITSEHVASNVFFGEIGAQFLLVGEIQIQEPVDQANHGANQSTQYNNSAFITKGGEIHGPSQRISGILLMGIAQDSHSVVGILNPVPKHKFPIGNLPTIPFLQLDVWPPVDGVIRTQWVIGSPDFPRFKYSVFSLTEREYRGLG